MRVLIIHNKYQIRGGEEEACEAERELLEGHGHQTRSVVFVNTDIRPRRAAMTGLLAAWRPSAYRCVAAELDAWRPDVVHVHNFFPLATPAAHYAAWWRGVPVVQTLHNFRLLCPGASLFREGTVCEECVGRSIPGPSMIHKCYRGSRAATVAVCWMLALHRVMQTWRKQVSVFIALTEFNRCKFIKGGLPPDKIVTKQNFVPLDLGAGPGDSDYVLYVGRLSEEKGIASLMAAWDRVKGNGRLVIAGDGPLRTLVREKTAANRRIEYLGRTPLRNVYELMGRARALVFPSLWYEGMPRVIIEAFCRGTPVLASRLGSMEEMIREDRTGWFVKPGDPESLARALERSLTGEEVRRMRPLARAAYETEYTPGRNLELLESIYARALAGRGAQVRAS